MKKLTDFVISGLTSGKYSSLKDEANMDAMLRLIVLNLTYTVASVIIITLGVLDMRLGIINNGLIQIILGFMIFLNLSLLRTEVPFTVSGLIITTIYGAFCGVSIFVKHEMHGMGGLWIFSFPLMSIFTLGLSVGLIPALIILAAAIVGSFGSLSRYNYSSSESVILCGVYIFVTVITAVYEYVRSFKERWLARQDRYMNLVFDNSPDIIMLLDKNKSLVHCAKVFLQRAKIENFEEIRKKSYSDVFARFADAEMLNGITAYFQSSREGKKSITVERVLDFGNDGHPRHYEIHFTPMFNVKNEFQGAFMLFHDMTEILDARDRAEQASRSKSNFLANMSHEIRTPLNAIIGMTTIAKDSGDIKRKDYCLSKIESASAYLLGIINDILDMSKIEQDKFELSCTEFEFSAMIQRVVNIFEFRLGEKKQKLIVNHDPSIPKRIITDDQRLAQVITNLISNAVKFTPEEGSITLSTRRLEDKEQNYCTLEIRVADTGIGIPKEQQSKLFRSFVQVDSSIARKFGGTGLGLAISKKIVELMNGEIQVDSEENKGASFIFTLRAGIPVITSDSSAEIPDGFSVPDVQSDFHGKRILLAEDVEINREIVVTLLEPLGLEIIEAEDGQKAFDLFRADPEGFDLIFMDIHMPGVDGYESTKLIRTMDHPIAKTVPIIAMTANVFREDVERCHAAGMNDHIGKPLDFAAVMATLSKYLG
ncbi:MAG: response regulator [Spirochaetaceae bacterium]|jgi:signal transduction histidine kinase|nr:response regulator [Spirochaetaceae bacterium]